MGLSVIEISEFCKEELEKAFDKKFDIYDDNIVDKVRSILHGDLGYDYFSDFCDEMLDAIIENIQSMKLQDLKKNSNMDIIEELDYNTKKRIKELISLRFMIFYNNIFQNLNEIMLELKTQDILDDEEEIDDEED